MHRRMTAAAAAAALVTAAPAVAQTPQEGYQQVPGAPPQPPAPEVPPAPVEQAPPQQAAPEEAAPAPDAGVTVSGEGAPAALPFSGLDLGLVALAGALLVGTGLVLRRQAHRSA